MGLYGPYFASIREGRKTVEVRLSDAKRRKINVGDIIEFIEQPELGQTLQVQVVGLREYRSFREMYENIPFREFDCEGWSMQEMLDGTYEIYTPEQETKWGTLAISMKYID
jgi:ASC-1-like (ASCH) protein